MQRRLLLALAGLVEVAMTWKYLVRKDTALNLPAISFPPVASGGNPGAPWLASHARASPRPLQGLPTTVVSAQVDKAWA